MHETAQTQEPLTNQRAFDIALTELRKQRVRSADSFGRCLYRGPNNTKCAVGHMIPDKLFEPSMNPASVGNLLTGGSPELKDLFAGVGRELLSDLQVAHDSDMPRQSQAEHKQSLNAWEEHMRTIALRHGLIYTPPAA